MTGSQAIRRWVVSVFATADVDHTAAVESRSPPTSTRRKRRAGFPPVQTAGATWSGRFGLLRIVSQ